MNPSLLCFRKSPVAKNLWIRGGGEYQYFPSKFFCLTEPMIFIGESFPVALISGSEKVRTREGGEYQDIPWKKFCFTVPKKFVGESFTVALISGIEKVWIRVGGGECQDIPSAVFCLTVPKIFVGESFTVALFSGTGKVWIRSGGGGGVEYQYFLSTFFVSQCRRNSQVNLSLLFFRKIPVAKKILDKRGEYQDFPSENFCLTVPKIFVGELLNVALILGTEKTWIKGGEYQVFPWKIFCFTVPKNFVRQLFSVAVISGTEKTWIKRGVVSRFSVENFLCHSAEIIRR